MRHHSLRQQVMLSCALRISRSRSGFTLVELLVAIALTITIMGIIGWAMGKSVDTFRNLRAIADLQTRLRSAEIVLRRDLAAEHFGGNHRPGFGGPFLSDQRLDLVGWMPPEQGYFEIRQGSGGINEGSDLDGVWSTRATDCRMRFTVRLSGKREEDWFYAYADNGGALPGTPTTGVMGQGDINFNRNGGVATRWGEVAYFLVQIPATERTANGTPLFTLYRRQLAVLPATTSTGTPISSDISRANGGTGNYNSPADVTNPANRVFGANFAAAPLGGVKQGDDILLTDVISFEIKVLWRRGDAVATIPEPRQPTANIDWPFDTFQTNFGTAWNPPNGLRFDTMSLSTAPGTNWEDPASFQAANNNLPRYRIRVQALQIRIRIWDFNTQQTRQMTFVQDI